MVHAQLTDGLWFACDGWGAQDWGLDAKIAGKIFRKFDVDQDGELNMEELKAVLAKTKK